MPYDRFLIAPMNAGLQSNLRPWLIPDEAFAELNNAYCFRGRIRKRFGSMYMGVATGTIPQVLSSRLSIFVGTTDAFGDLSGTVPGHIFKIGQLFSVDSTIFTVYQIGAPAPMLRNDGSVSISTYDTTNGNFVITNTFPLADVYFYPAEPVMGLTVYERGPINDQPSFAFDTEFAYIFSSGFWQRSIAGTPPVWHGTNLNFFWATNWEGVIPGQTALIVTNYFVVNPNGGGSATDDPIWWFIDSIGWTPGTGVNAFYFAPAGGAPHTGPFVKTALIILPFQGRLVLLNTIENDNGGGLGTNTQYVNRCRFSAVGSPFAQNAWYEPNQQDNAATPGGLSLFAGGGFIDATTEERIVSAEFIKDRLIVYFERSTWELAYTGNQVLPFVWQKINTELGSEATFSTVPFDKVILTVGNTGIHGCSGANVERIDDLIPERIFEINAQLNNTGVTRVCGIRDYYVEMVYWAFPSNSANKFSTYPNRILVYNYRNSTWAFNDDCITAFGYFEQEESLTWQNATFAWEKANMAWNSGTFEAQSRQVIAGNQEGFVFLVEADVNSNEAVMQLTNIVVDGTGLDFVIIDHTLQENDFIYVTDIQEALVVNGDMKSIFQVAKVLDKDTVFINPVSIVGAYTGGAFVGRVSRIDILSKQWNPYVSKGRNVYLAKIDFGLFKTDEGEVTVDYFPSYTELSMIDEATGNNAIMGNSVLSTAPFALYPLELEQNLLWHPIYFQTDGEAVQIRIFVSDTQLLEQKIDDTDQMITQAFMPFELEGMVLHTQATASRLQ